MAKPMTAEEILALVTGLTPRERIRLLRLIAASAPVGAAAAYAAVPPGSDEFVTDDEPLGWEADGWEEVG